MWVVFNRSQKLSSAKRNMRSALEHPEVVQEYLDFTGGWQVAGAIPTGRVAESAHQ